MKQFYRRSIRFLCLLLCAAFCLGALPAAAEEDPYYHFQTVSELKELLSRGEKQLWAIDESDEARVITEDLTIPEMNMVFFGKGTVTIPEGVTVTIKDGGSLSFHDMDLKGTINNRGSLIQAEPEEGDEAGIRISGTLNNGGWFIYYKVEGIERMKNNKGYTIDQNETPEPLPEPTPEPTPVPIPTPRKRTISMSLERMLQRLRFTMLRLKAYFLRNGRDVSSWIYTAAAILIFLVTLLSLSRRGKKTAREKTQRPEYRQKQAHPAAKAKTGSLSEEQRRRIDRLDDWLKDGLIDREEYKRLKERYRGDK